jgi:hypothetical protein
VDFIQPKADGQFTSITSYQPTVLYQSRSLCALAVATATRPEVLPDFPTVGALVWC